MDTERKSYPLLPFSQLVFDISRGMPEIYTILRLELRVSDVPYDMAVKVISAAFRNHPALRMCIDKKGRQYYNPNADALHGQFHRLSLEEKNGALYIDVKFNRILGDERSLEILLEDAVCAYFGKELQQDDYIGYLEHFEQLKLTEHYAGSREWLIGEFGEIDVPVRPTIDSSRLHTILPPKAGVLEDEYSDMHDAILQLMRIEHLTMDGVFSLCTALAIADYCDTDEAALTWAYEGRDRTEEQHIFGSLHKDIPFRIKRSNDKKALLRMTRNRIRSGIAHSDYPYTLTPPYSERWNYAVNVLRVDDWQTLINQLPVKIEILPQKPLRYAYALLDVEIHETTESLKLCFRYSATHYKKESMLRFSALIRKNVEWLLTD